MMYSTGEISPDAMRKPVGNIGFCLGMQLGGRIADPNRNSKFPPGLLAPFTGGEGWCSHLVHHKYIARKWTKYQLNTYPGYFKYVQNIPSQFPCNFPTMENLEYFCNVPSGGIVEVHVGGRRPKWIDVINTNIYYTKIPTVT